MFHHKSLLMAPYRTCKGLAIVLRIAHSTPNASVTGVHSYASFVNVQGFQLLSNTYNCTSCELINGKHIYIINPDKNKTWNVNGNTNYHKLLYLLLQLSFTYITLEVDGIYATLNLRTSSLQFDCRTLCDL